VTAINDLVTQGAPLEDLQISPGTVARERPDFPTGRRSS
jgi:hypothetical protein